MLGGLVAVAVLSGMCAYIVGYAFVAPSDSFLRSPAGGMVLAACVLIALAIPPTLADLVSTGTIGTWPARLNPAAYHAAWVSLTAMGLLSGVRAWRMRFRRGGGGVFTFDESPVGRARAQLPLADSLDAALDVLARETPSDRNLGSVADAIRAVGTRFWHQLPERDGEVYNLVRRHVPPALAADVTRLLLEGAQRKSRA